MTKLRPSRCIAIIAALIYHKVAIHCGLVNQEYAPEKELFKTKHRKDLSRLVLGPLGAAARSLATGVILGKAGGEEISSLSPHTVEHLVQFLVKAEGATISPALLTVR